jgi:hypothetical protein
MQRFRVGVQFEPQHCSVDELRDGWRRAEELGAHSIWTWDHFFPLSGDPDGRHFEGWSLLAALACDTVRPIGPRELQPYAHLTWSQTWRGRSITSAAWVVSATALAGPSRLRGVRLRLRTARSVPRHWRRAPPIKARSAAQPGAAGSAAADDRRRRRTSHARVAAEHAGILTGLTVATFAHKARP